MIDHPWVRIHHDRRELGAAAARDIAAELRRLLGVQDRVRVLFAAAPSQSETLAALAAEAAIDWTRVTAFHLDEYLGLPRDAPQRFSNWLNENLFKLVPIGETVLMDVADDVGELLAGYARRLTEAPIDIACLGIGVNGHIAFNDPPVADFADPSPIKVVSLDDVSRQQQVDDGCFAAVDDVPRQAVTLTIPTVLAARRLFCVAPGHLKAAAVRATLLNVVSTDWPSTILRSHPGCTLYLDAESARQLREEIAA